MYNESTDRRQSYVQVDLFLHFCGVRFLVPRLPSLYIKIPGKLVDRYMTEADSSQDFESITKKPQVTPSLPSLFTTHLNITLSKRYWPALFTNC